MAADAPTPAATTGHVFPGGSASEAALAGLDALDLREQRTGGLPARIWASLWPKVLAIALVLAIWELIHLSGYKKSIFPAPGPTLANLWDQLHTGLLWHAIGTTLQRAVIGFALAILIGGVVGALVSRIRPLRAAVGSLITGLQTLPSIAWFPFAIILFGNNTTAILFVIVLGAAPSIANGLITGVDYTPPLLLKAGTMMGLRRLSLYRFLILPASLPAFVAGLKQGWAFAWRSLMAGELLVIIANQPSLGVLLNTNQDQSDLVSATAIIIVILIIGICVDAAFGAADRTIRRRWGLTASA
ncbi:MAG: ABC transporter permease subunit [Streptosporangiaceae bacterium]|nr:ABC transporter permease subunit [Streptosporangiaceae bacterium]